MFATNLMLFGYQAFFFSPTSQKFREKTQDVFAI